MEPILELVGGWWGAAEVGTRTALVASIGLFFVMSVFAILKHYVNPGPRSEGELAHRAYSQAMALKATEPRRPIRGLDREPSLLKPPAKDTFEEAKDGEDDAREPAIPSPSLKAMRPMRPLRPVRKDDGEE